MVHIARGKHSDNFIRQHLPHIVICFCTHRSSCSDRKATIVPTKKKGCYRGQESMGMEEDSQTNDSGMKRPENNSSQQQRENHHHDTHATPPQEVCDAYKHYRCMRDSELVEDETVIDLSKRSTGERGKHDEKIRTLGSVSKEKIETACLNFVNWKQSSSQVKVTSIDDAEPCTIYEHVDFPGLRIYPGLLPPSCQTVFLSRLLHRDLADPLHKNNLQDDFAIPYPSQQPNGANLEYPSASFFALSQASCEDELHPRPQSGSVKPLNMAQFLRKRLRWLTLGAQYDWPTRAYPLPENVPSVFPEDIRTLVSDLFPRVKAESGVVLVYSPKDFMPVHRDVSEECYRELCSFSLGCDGIFLLALPIPDYDADASAAANGQNVKVRSDEDGQSMNTIAIRVRSGDMVQLSGEARWAWHAMPKAIAGTCPDWLRDWPVTQNGSDLKNFKHWKGYMENKRFNISCRQVWDD